MLIHFSNEDAPSLEAKDVFIHFGPLDWVSGFGVRNSMCFQKPEWYRRYFRSIEIQIQMFEDTFVLAIYFLIHTLKLNPSNIVQSIKYFRVSNEVWGLISSMLSSTGDRYCVDQQNL